MKLKPGRTQELLRKLAPACRIKTIQVPQKELKGVLESGEVDLAIGSIYSVSSELFQQRLFAHPFVCIASPITLAPASMA